MDFLSQFLKLFFRLLYHEFAWSYDFISTFISGGRWNIWTKSILCFLQGPEILELGFGPGHLLLKIFQLGYNAFGLDASLQMVRQAQKRLIRSKFSSQLVRGSGQFLPFQSNFMNCIVSTFPTAYIFQASTLNEIHRILVPGGRLVILLSAWITAPSLNSRFLAWVFRITGQVLPDSFEELKLLSPFQEAEFTARLEWMNLPGSRLLFIIATKSS
jgi:ubiquinone/menaquinone biosynthesis C-methylase UbiE